MALAPRHGRTEPRPPPKVREGEDASHRAMVSRLPCIVCGVEEPRVNVDPHHLQRSVPKDQRGMGLRAVDKYTVPLCRDVAAQSMHHDEVESGGDDEAWLAERGIQGRDVAAELWRRRGDFEAMRDYVIRHLFGRGVYVR
jgi:hypothetical protein